MSECFVVGRICLIPNRIFSIILVSWWYLEKQIKTADSVEPAEILVGVEGLKPPTLSV